MGKSVFFIKIYKLVYEQIPTLFNCIRCGLPFNPTWAIKGKPYILRRKWYDRILRKLFGGRIVIGKEFHCNNKIDSNSVGLIQPCVFNIEMEGSQILIGNNVGISGSTINAACSIVIEDNVLIGSGCLITDTNSHPVDYIERVNGCKCDSYRGGVSPIIIHEGSFIGARSIILKGVTIGYHSVVGAGSVVTKDVPDNCVVCGNPARVVKYLDSNNR